MSELWAFDTSLLQDTDWEEVDTEDAETDQDLLYSASAKLHGRPTYEYLDAMAKAFDEVWQFTEHLLLYLFQDRTFYHCS